MTAAPLLLDSITDAKENAAGEVVVSGSHGGLYAATLASRAAVRAVVFSDAGIGLERAGVAGVLALAEVGLAAAAADYRTCRIGIATDALQRGRISVTNPVAADLGVEPGMPVAEAVSHLCDAATPRDRLPAQQESRRQVLLEPANTIVWLLDSASLVRSDDRGQIIVIGSHGGLSAATRRAASRPSPASPCSTTPASASMKPGSRGCRCSTGKASPASP